MGRSLQKSKSRSDTGHFLKIPTAVLDSQNFRPRSSKAKALVLDIGAEFNGFNNGYLGAPWSAMKKRGWNSKDTLKNALDELLHFGILELTKQGGLGIGCSLYGFTWLSIAESKTKSDVRPTRVPSSKWRAPLVQEVA